MDSGERVWWPRVDRREPQARAPGVQEWGRQHWGSSNCDMLQRLGAGWLHPGRAAEPDRVFATNTLRTPISQKAIARGVLDHTWHPTLSTPERARLQTHLLLQCGHAGGQHHRRWLRSGLGRGGRFRRVPQRRAHGGQDGIGGKPGQDADGERTGAHVRKQAAQPLHRWVMAAGAGTGSSESMRHGHWQLLPCRQAIASSVGLHTVVLIMLWVGGWVGMTACVYRQRACVCKAWQVGDSCIGSGSSKTQEATVGRKAFSGGRCVGMVAWWQGTKERSS